MQTVPKIGQTLLDRYYVEEILDASGDTAILKCMDTRLDVYDIVKFLLGDDTAHDWELRRQHFIQSFRAMARLNHPNIIHVANIETRCGLTFSVMEMLQGPRLDDFLDGGVQLEAKETLELFLSIIDAVVMAHSCDVLHKRLSPAQIILNYQGARLSPRILNFLSFKNSRDLDIHSAIPYLAPEQYKNFDNATPASDIFALCATMYAIFAHEPPLKLNSIEEFASFYEQCPGIDWFPASVPPEFVPILSGGLRSNPAERQWTALSLLQAIKKLSANFKLSANLSIDATKGNLCAHPSLAPISGVIRHAGQTGSQPSFRSGFHQAASSSQPILHQGTHSQTAARPLTQSKLQPVAPATPPVNPEPPNMPSSAKPVDPAPNVSNPEKQIEQIDGISLPESLREIYALRRVIHSDDHAFIALVSTRHNANDLYGLKCFYANTTLEKSIFNEGVRRSDLLAQKTPYIQSVFQSYPDECAFLMSDIQRQSLPESLKQNGVYPPDVVAQIGVLLGEAMNTAHQHGFVNGNLKPNNILFENRNGVVTPVIYDFGQALYINSLVALSPDAVPYVAPELHYNLQTVNAQADIFAFGMCLVFMLIGRTPYASSQYDVAKEVESMNDLPDLKSFAPDIPDGLNQVLRWCTAFDPAQRYVHFSDIVRDLRVVYQQLTAC